MTTIRFGTDGWRAVIAQEFTFANLDRVAQAAAAAWRQQLDPGQPARVIVGYDRRFLSDQFARRTCEILVGNGFETLLSDRPVPTPALAFATKKRGAVGGVMITASHNPARFNGFKMKAAYGGSADPEFCRMVESLVDRWPVAALPWEQAKRSRQVRVVDLHRDHRRAIHRYIDFDAVAQSGLRFAHDAMYGVGAGVFDELLGETTCRVTTLRAEHDPLFGGVSPEPIAANYEATSAWLRRHPHDLCLVTDGDADRVGAMDGRGRALSTHQIICLLLEHLLATRGASGRVIKALTTTSMVDKMCWEYGLPLTETPVGFKVISAEMAKGEYTLGAEESGGLGFPGHIPERDGLLAGLVLLEMLAMRRQGIRRMIQQLERKYGPHRYGRTDLPLPVERRVALVRALTQSPPSKIAGVAVSAIHSFDGLKLVARDGSWLMWRGSGTEPILRIYAEAPSEQQVERLLRQGRRLLASVDGRD